MSSCIGTIEKVYQNKGGYYSVLIEGTWYGTGGKDAPTYGKGQKVKFDYEMKDGKYATIRGPVKVSADTPSPQPDEPKKSWGGGAKKARGGSGGGVKDTYWKDKEVYDKTVVQPRIAYQGALERAIQIVLFVDSKGGYPGLAKVKPTDMLEAVRALVDAETDRLFALSAKAQFPTDGPTAESTGEGDEEFEAAEADEASDEQWK